MNSPKLWITVATLSCLLGAARVAEARKRSGFVKGETIDHIGIAKGGIAAEARAVLGGGTVELGFKYSYVGLGSAPLWTWDGGFVLYNSAGGNVSQYINLTDAQAREANGGTMPGKPFLYRVPIGLIVFGLLIGGGLLYYFALRPLKKRRRAKQLDALASDPRYIHALQMTAAVEYRDEDGDLVTAPRHSAKEAVDWLVAQGIPREQAQDNYWELEARRDAADDE